MTISRRSLLIGAAAAGFADALPPPRDTRTVTPELQVPQPMTQPPALFVGCHPDDETLAMGVDIARHAGQDVHVLLLTRGTGSGVINRLNGTNPKPSKWWGVMHDPVAEGYDPLTLAEFGEARIREATNAIRCLAPDVTIHEGGLIDGQVTQTDAEAAILAVADQIAPGGPVRLKTHSHTVDDHSDHLAAGAAVDALGQADATRFSDRRYYVLSRYWDDPRLSQVTQPVWVDPDTSEQAARAVNACRAYAAWSPPHTFAIGHHSTPDLFEPLMEQPRCLRHK